MIQAKDVRKVTGLSYRQIQYWDSRIVTVARKPGKSQKVSFRTFTEKDVLLYRAVANLKKMGVSLQMIRKYFLGQLQDIFRHEHFGPYSKIIAWGNKLALVHDSGGIYAPLNRDNKLFKVILDYNFCIAMLQQSN